MSVSDYIFVIMCLIGCGVALIGNFILCLFADKRFREYLKIIEKENKDE